MGIVKSKENFSAISLSGGKDSTALMLLMIEKGLPIDSVLYAIVYRKSGNCMISTISHILSNGIAIASTLIFFMEEFI